MSSQIEWKQQSKQDRIIVALDCDEDKAYKLAYLLKNKAKWLKIGMTLYYSCGPEIIDEFKNMGFKTFVDLKLHDIPHQVKGAAYSLTLAGADLFTVHASGGSEMMEAAYEGAKHAHEDYNGCKIPDICAVTVLTSMSNSTLQSIGVERDAKTEVELLANLVSKTKLNGIVCSPQEAKLTRNIVGGDALVVTPGVRPKGADVGDQSRIATPQKAFEAGASHIVIGRPITQAQNPAEAFLKIAKEI